MSTCPHSKSSPQTFLRSRRYAASEVRKLQGDMQALAPAVAWVDEFVTQSNRDLGRPGCVCPFVPPALEQDTMDFFVIPVEVADKDKQDERSYSEVLEPAILEIRDHFLAKQNRAAKPDLFQTLLIVFKGIELEEKRASFLIEKIQRKLKPDFVERGLMLGEFHPHSDALGLRNPDFRPLRSPVPLLSMRNMVDIDFAFLNRPSDPAPLRVRFLTAYLHYVGDSIAAPMRRTVERALEIAQEQSLQLAGLETA